MNDPRGIIQLSPDPFDFPVYESVEPAKILRYLYLSRYSPSCDQGTLATLGVTHIINLANIPHCEEFLHIKYTSFSVQDDPSVDLGEAIEDSFDFIESAARENWVVLAHCQAGISRSATIVIAYLMKKFDMNLKDSYLYVLKRRPCISPNPGFIQQLSQLELTLGKEPSLRVVDYLANEIRRTFPHISEEDARALVIEHDSKMPAIMAHLFFNR